MADRRPHRVARAGRPALATPSPGRPPAMRAGDGRGRGRRRRLRRGPDGQRARGARSPALFGHEAALFVPSGTMGNQIGMRLVVRAGPGAALRRRRARGHLRDGRRGRDLRHLHPHLVVRRRPARRRPADRRMVRPNDRLAPDRHRGDRRREHPQPRRRRWCSRSTSCAKLLATGRASAGVAVHLDGARIWNAARRRRRRRWRPTAGSSTPCRSACPRGSGAPVGSVLVVVAPSGSRPARLWRKRLGGGMRQVGILAAAGLYALDHHLDRLAEDHEHAQLLAKRLGVDPSTVRDQHGRARRRRRAGGRRGRQGAGRAGQPGERPPDPAGRCTSTSTGRQSTAPPTC